MSDSAGEEFRVKSRIALPADEVRALSRISAARSTWSIVKTVALAAACVTAALLSRGHRLHPLVVASAIIGLAGAQHGLAVLAHEAAHYRSYQTRWLNDLAGKLCAAPLGLSMLTYRLIHRIHHNHLYEASDPDLALMAGYPRGRGYLLRKLGKDLLGITTLKNYYYFVGKPNQSRPLDDTSPRLRAAAARERRFVAVATLAFLALSIYFGFWRWYLLLWFLPLVTLLQAILRLRAILEHGAVDDKSTPLKAARTNFVPGCLYWILFPHDVHYHIEHHLYPSIPHYRLAACHRRLRGLGILDGAEVATLGQVMRKVFANPRAYGPV
ncbi:MAG: Fatty acid desaturase [Myxococcales bacterium]|nr:Fatty acid desaturase [Myxococcales bacterium]